MLLTKRFLACLKVSLCLAQSARHLCLTWSLLHAVLPWHLQSCAVLLHAILESKHAVMFLLVYTDHPHRHITAAHVQVFLCSCWSVHWNCCCACCSGNAHEQCPRDLPLPFPLPLGFSGAFLAPFLPSAAGAGGGGGNGGFKMILEPESALSGKSGYSPVSGSLFSRNHALICATNQRRYSAVSALLLP